MTVEHSKVITEPHTHFLPAPRPHHPTIQSGIRPKHCCFLLKVLPPQGPKFVLLVAKLQVLSENKLDGVAPLVADPSDANSTADAVKSSQSYNRLGKEFSNKSDMKLIIMIDS